MKRFQLADLGRKAERACVAFRLVFGFGAAMASVVALPIEVAEAGGQPPLPSGGVVVPGGGATTIIQPNSTTLNINQNTNKAIINWNSFSVGRGDTVNFNQPGASSATLNRVTGATPSWVAGTINAPGAVLLVNPNGVEITKSGVINTGSFAASTLDIKDSDFLHGNYAFTGNGASAGVINNGRINVSDGGFAALLGGQVANNGVISARLGSVGLGAGEQATLDLSGDGFLSVTVPSSEMGKLVDANGALVGNKGKIVANGGQVYLSAATAANLLRNAVNIPGSVRTNTVGMHNGRIVINGGYGGAVSGRLAANGGKRRKGGLIAIAGRNVNVSGKLAANGASGGTISVAAGDQLALSGALTATGKRGQGGEIDLTAANVALTGAIVDASGASGGGNINIGGGPHATVALADAQSLLINRASLVRADATSNGAGGHIVVWSDGLTTAQGAFSARGGPRGGAGGLIETSGQSINVADMTANASASKGAAGTWLFDPVDLIIDGTLATEIDASLAGGTSVTLATSASNTPTTPYALTTGETNTSGTGSILVDSGLSWSTAATLALSAFNSIDINAAITVGGAGALVLTTNNNTGGTSSGGALNIANDQGSVQFAGGGSLTINGTPYTLLSSMAAVQNINAKSLKPLRSGQVARRHGRELDTDWHPVRSFCRRL